MEPTSRTASIEPPDENSLDQPASAQWAIQRKLGGGGRARSRRCRRPFQLGRVDRKRLAVGCEALELHWMDPERPSLLVLLQGAVGDFAPLVALSAHHRAGGKKEDERSDECYHSSTATDHL